MIELSYAKSRNYIWLIRMTKNNPAIKFYTLLVLLYFSDMVLLLSNIWNSLKVTSSPIFLGITLSIGSVLPFILQKIKILKIRPYLSINELYKRRILVYSFLLLISLVGFSSTKFGFITISLCIGYLSLITLSTLESSNAKLVLNGHISSHRAARTMQTVVQVGSFFGAMLSGYLLTKLNFNSLIAYLSVFDIIISLLGKKIYSDEGDDKQEVKIKDGVHKIFIKKNLKILCITIGLVGLHIAAFNTLTPILFQGIRELGAEYYGICSGVGAFIAAFVNIKRFKFLLPALSLTMSDFIFTFTLIPYLAIAACFIIGFSINTIRINARKKNN